MSGDVAAGTVGDRRAEIVLRVRACAAQARRLTTPCRDWLLRTAWELEKLGSLAPWDPHRAGKLRRIENQLAMWQGPPETPVGIDFSRPGMGRSRA